MIYRLTLLVYRFRRRRSKTTTVATSTITISIRIPLPDVTPAIMGAVPAVGQYKVRLSIVVHSNQLSIACFVYCNNMQIILIGLTVSHNIWASTGR